MAAETKNKNKREGQVQFKVWLPEAERRLFKSEAQKAGMTDTDWLRHRCIKTAPRRRRKGPDVMALHRLLGLMGNISSNVNQIAARANTSGNVPALEKLDRIETELKKITGQVGAALGYDLKG